MEIIIFLCIRFPLEMHIVHKKVGEPNFLSVEGGLAVTGFFFEVQLLRILARACGVPAVVVRA